MTWTAVAVAVGTFVEGVTGAIGAPQQDDTRYALTPDPTGDLNLGVIRSLTFNGPTDVKIVVTGDLEVATDMGSFGNEITGVSDGDMIRVQGIQAGFAQVVIRDNATDDYLRTYSVDVVSRSRAFSPGFSFGFA